MNQQPYFDYSPLQERYPQRPAVWKLRTKSLDLTGPPLLMGIVNVTPDSFSDGGKFAATEAAVQQAELLAAHGADILDIGGESTRPYAEQVDAAEELRRVENVVAEVCRRVELPVSIDTSKAVVARAALDGGAEIINDVTGLEGDPAMAEIASSSEAGVCAMHMQGTPQTMQDAPTYNNVVEDIYDYLLSRKEALLEMGIPLEKICLDPGIGFGKTHQHNLQLLQGCERFHDLGCPVLVGHSRKGFIAHILGDKTTDRTAGTIGTTLALARQGVQILRVHDVQPMRQALDLFVASGGLQNSS